MSNILVIGGAGFIGSNLVEALADKHSVVVIDNLFLGSEENLSEVRDRITFHKHDYCDEDFITKVLNENKIDYVFHFGGFSSAPMFDGKEAEGYAANIVGFAQLLRQCVKAKVKRLLYASTSSIYGGLRVQEEESKVYPPNFYSVTKYTMEHTARLFHEMYGLESIGFRFFSVYGKNEEHKGKYANLVTQFLWAIQNGEPVIIYGNGTQTRDFTYVKDLVRALIVAMKVDKKFAQGSYYNVGTSVSYSLNDMVKVLEEETGKKGNIKYVKNLIKNYVQDTLASTEKIERDFGFRPKFSLRDGIKDMIK